MQRTVVSKLFGYFVSSSGINETEAPYYGFDVDSVTRTFHARTFFEVENNFEVTLKLVFDKETRVIMGGQIITSDRGSLEIINTVSTLITSYMTLDQLATMDYFFNPTISFPLHFLNQLAIEGLFEISCELNVLYIKSFLFDKPTLRVGLSFLQKSLVIKSGIA